MKLKASFFILLSWFSALYKELAEGWRLSIRHEKGHFITVTSASGSHSNLTPGIGLWAQRQGHRPQCNVHRGHGDRPPGSTRQFWPLSP